MKFFSRWYITYILYPSFWYTQYDYFNEHYLYKNFSFCSYGDSEDEECWTNYLDYLKVVGLFMFIALVVVEGGLGDAMGCDLYFATYYYSIVFLILAVLSNSLANPNWFCKLNCYFFNVSIFFLISFSSCGLTCSTLRHLGYCYKYVNLSE